MAPKEVEVADSYEEALQKFSSLAPKVVFVDYEMKKGQSGFDFYNVFKETHKSRLETLFFLVTEKNSDSLASRVAEEDIDSMVVRPFTYTALEKLFLDVISNKLKPSDYFKIIEQGKVLITEQKFEEAMTVLAGAKGIDPKPTLACYYEGVAAKALKNIEKAQACFEAGLAIEPTHYKCLFGLFDLKMEGSDFEKAYALATKISQSHPISPNRIPTFVRLSVVNRAYDDILNYYRIFSELDQADAMLATYIAAGLVICGKSLLNRGNSKDGLSALKKATEVCKGKVSILQEIIVTLFKAGLEEEAGRELSKAPDAVKNDPKVLLAELELIQKKGSKDHVLQRCLELLKQGVKEELVFELAISYSVELQRRKDAVEELVAAACLAHPARSDHFKGLASGKASAT